jgi:hypothetical protein
MIDHFLVVRKSFGLAFGKNSGLTGRDLINAVTAGNQFRSDVQFFFNEVRQTGSPWFVVSNGTIGDFDFHTYLPFGFGWVSSRFHHGKTSGIGCDIAKIIVKVNYFYCNDCEIVSVNS